MINIPFNFDPVSSEVKTGAYTIPTGYYAYVEAQVDDNGFFEIDTVQALKANIETADPDDKFEGELVLGASDSGVIATSFSQGRSVVYVSNNSNSLNTNVHFEVDGTRIKNTIDAYETLKFELADTQQLTMVTGAGGGANVGYLHIKGRARSIKDNIPQVGSFWVAEGTDLDITNGRYTVSLFRKIT